MFTNKNIHNSVFEQRGIVKTLAILLPATREPTHLLALSLDLINMLQVLQYLIYL